MSVSAGWLWLLTGCWLSPEVLWLVSGVRKWREERRAGVMRSSRDSEVTNQRPVLPRLTNQRPALITAWYAVAGRRKTMGSESIHYSMQSLATRCYSDLTNEKRVLSSLTNGWPAFIIPPMHHAAETKHYLQDLSSYVSMSRKPRFRNGTEHSLTAACYSLSRNVNSLMRS